MSSDVAQVLPAPSRKRLRCVTLRSLRPFRTPEWRCTPLDADLAFEPASNGGISVVTSNDLTQDDAAPAKRQCSSVVDEVAPNDWAQRRLGKAIRGSLAARLLAEQPPDTSPRDATTATANC
eukprot:EG_transcript_50142